MTEKDPRPRFRLSGLELARIRQHYPRALWYRDRYGAGGAWCGRDLYDDTDEEVGFTLSAVGDPK
jgi:hypothetical protein